MENRVTVTIKTGQYLELSMAEAMELLGSTKSRKIKIKMVKICLI